MNNIVKYFYGMRAPSDPTVFETIVHAICEQQISLRVASLIYKRLVQKFGSNIMHRGNLYYDSPSPHTLAKASVDELRSCGISKIKAEYIISISKEIVKGTFEPEELRGCLKMRLLKY